MARKYTKVLELMQRKGGRVDVDDPELTSLLGRLAYKISGYMSCIRRYAKLDINAVRDGRKVVAYELVAIADATSAATPIELEVSTVPAVTV